MNDLQTTLDEVLGEHLKRNITSCDCGWSEIGKLHYPHVAEMQAAALAEWVREERARVLEEAAYEITRGEQSTPGLGNHEQNSGMSDATLWRDVVGWLNDRADNERERTP